MSKSFLSTLDQVRKLSKAEQLAIMDAILQLLRAEEDHVLSAAWEAELDRRDELLDRGEMPTADWKSVRERIMKGTSNQ